MHARGRRAQPAARCRVPPPPHTPLPPTPLRPRSPPSAASPPGVPPPPALPCQPFTWEILIVNDGSKDTTATVAMDYVRREGHERVRLLNLFKNNGKGAAVRKGAQRARGQFVLMADADGATRFADVDTLLAEVGRVVAPNGEGVAIGSRAHAAGAEGKAKRSPLRRVLMWGFHMYMSLMVGGAGIKDTQCGFKLFTRPSARKLFDVLHIERCVCVAARHGAARRPPRVWAGRAQRAALSRDARSPAARLTPRPRLPAPTRPHPHAPSQLGVRRGARVPRGAPAHAHGGGARHVARGGRLQGGPHLRVAADGARHSRHPRVLHVRRVVRRGADARVGAAPSALLAGGALPLAQPGGAAAAAATAASAGGGRARRAHPDAGPSGGGAAAPPSRARRPGAARAP